MSCESDEADLALLPGQIGRLDSAVDREDHLRVFLAHDFVELPQIDHIGPQAAQLSSRCFMAVFLSRPWCFVMRKTFFR